MLYGNAQSIVAFVRNLLSNLDGILQNDFLSKVIIEFDKNIYVCRSNVSGKCNGHFDHWFSNTKAFLCGIWNFCREKFYLLDSWDLVLHSSIYRCVVNGRNARAARSAWQIYEIFIYTPATEPHLKCNSITDKTPPLLFLTRRDQRYFVLVSRASLFFGGGKPLFPPPKKEAGPRDYFVLGIHSTKSCAVHVLHLLKFFLITTVSVNSYI